MISISWCSSCGERIIAETPARMTGVCRACEDDQRLRRAAMIDAANLSAFRALAAEAAELLQPIPNNSTMLERARELSRA